MRRYQYTRVVRGIVEYLEEIDLPGSTKKAIAMAVVKALHKQTGGKWDKEIEQAISGAIEWTLAEIREAARDWNQPRKPEPGPAEPPDEPDTTTNYGVWERGTLPTEDVLIDAGFRTGDAKWVSHNLEAWTVTRAGEIPRPYELHPGQSAGVIGG